MCFFIFYLQVEGQEPAAVASATVDETIAEEPEAEAEAAAAEAPAEPAVRQLPPYLFRLDLNEMPFFQT